MNRYLWSASLKNFRLNFTNSISFCYIRIEFSHNLRNFIILRDAVCFIPNPLMGGGTVYSSAFFVQKMLTAGCGRREMWVLSLENSYRVEFKI